MPATAVLMLRSVNGGKIPRSFNCLMHPVFLDRITKADPNMGEAIHNSGGMPPFAISPIMGIKKNRIEGNSTYWVRITFLTDAIETAFLSSLEKGYWHWPIHLESLIFLIEDLVLGPEESLPWSGRASYGEMIERSRGKEKLSLFIASPLSFKRGDLHYPMPEAALIFGNLSRRWNLFSELKLPENPECENIGYSFFDLKTTPYALRRGGTVIGVEGRIEFILKESEERRRYFETLLNFGFYSGIGIKTTQGMGMCRVH